MSEKYTRGNVPETLEDIRRFVEEELDKLGAIVNALVDGELEESHVAPGKPRNGMLRYADGTNWDPGSGKGIYHYDGTSWNLLG